MRPSNRNALVEVVSTERRRCTPTLLSRRRAASSMLAAIVGVRLAMVSPRRTGAALLPALPEAVQDEECFIILALGYPTLGGGIKVRTIRDETGKVIREVIENADISGQPSGGGTITGTTTIIREFDAAGRLTQYRLDANVVVTDAAGNRFRFTLTITFENPQSDPPGVGDLGRVSGEIDGRPFRTGGVSIGGRPPMFDLVIPVPCKPVENPAPDDVEEAVEGELITAQ